MPKKNNSLYHIRPGFHHSFLSDEFMAESKNKKTSNKRLLTLIKEVQQLLREVNTYRENAEGRLKDHIEIQYKKGFKILSTLIQIIEEKLPDLKKDGQDLMLEIEMKITCLKASLESLIRTIHYEYYLKDELAS